MGDLNQVSRHQRAKAKAKGWPFGSDLQAAIMKKLEINLPKNPSDVMGCQNHMF